MDKLLPLRFAPVLVFLSFSLCALADSVQFKVVVDLGVGISASHLNDRDEVLSVYQGGPAIWSPASGGFSKLILPGPAANYTDVYASGLNNAGQVVGGASDPPCAFGYCYSNTYAWVWNTPKTTAVEIISSGGSFQPYPQAINNRGTIIGNSCCGPWVLLNGSQGSRQFPRLGGRETFASDVNDADTIVGFSTDDIGLPHAFMSTNESNTLLGTLPGDGFSQAVAISNSGAVAGVSEHGQSYSDRIDRAFIWRPASGMVDLGTPAGMVSSVTAISDRDWIVGTWGQGRTTRPFLWRPGSSMIDLAFLVDLSGTDFESISNVWDINGRGDILASVLDKNGRSHTVLFSLVPEPHTWMFATGGLLLFIGWRARMLMHDRFTFHNAVGNFRRWEAA